MVIPDLSTLGLRLRHVRHELRKLKQTELAVLAGIKQPSLSDLETGATKEISGPVLIAICKVLKIRPEWLLNRAGAMDQGDIEAMTDGERELLQKHREVVAKTLAPPPTPPGENGPLARVAERYSRDPVRKRTNRTTKAQSGDKPRRT